MTTKARVPNRLAQEKSPYLLQHQSNPVDWYPWGADAFRKADSENKPVFLSIGYSSCHWCHVMERESFEDEEVAQVLNEGFVAIKVDREERPDIDHIYMQYCQALTGSGGWPLSVFITPQKKPFFAGTYFPKKSAYGRPGFIDILNTIREQWSKDRDALILASEEHTERLLTPAKRGGKQDLSEEALHLAFQMYRRSFDSSWGGFGPAPKFPTPHNLRFLLRYWKWTGEEEAMSMVTKTLDAMYDGGICDHLGGGFSRYSTDRKWLVPHFEKMLYDNALLAITYLEAYQATGDERYEEIARDIFRYVLRDMTSAEGAFFSAEDADSEGEEGKFYVWSQGEIIEVLGEDLGKRFCAYYGVTPEGNFEGKSILNRIRKQPDSLVGLVDLVDAQQRLFRAREARVHPYKDDKVLTSWNGLMIAALAFGGRVLGEETYIDAAKKACEFVLRRLRRSDGRLLARYRDGEAAYPAYLDDYANMVWAIMEIYHADFSPRWLFLAKELQDEQNRLFWDKEGGGYFFYGDDAEQLITRPKEVYDSATPSGNSVSATNLVRLSRMLYHPEYEEMAESLFDAFASQVNAYPTGHSHMLAALLHRVGPSHDVVVASKASAGEVRHELEALGHVFAPETSFLYVLDGDEYSRLREAVPFVRDIVARDGDFTYYVCRNFACEAPTNDISQVEKVLTREH